jgi:hypothetical protein
MKIPKPKFISRHAGRVKNPKLILIEDNTVPEGFKAIEPHQRKERE